ncbi:hypothetical protein TWF694_009210 [Orbilia ellipsospora]|uniref:Mitochondrial ATPase inhibitor n=1 Tax=Orbilia ellipsospora TaxID=2528407 RepID=A0AAV9XHJ9_9PEZI
MSSILLATRRIAATSSRSLPRAGVTSAYYSSYSSIHENNPDRIHEHKHISLKEQKDGKGQWHEDLASDSEAFIKAERQEIKATGEEIQKLQKETNKLLEKAGLKK